jgi:hypothetical protein
LLSNSFYMIFYAYFGYSSTFVNHEIMYYGTSGA